MDEVTLTEIARKINCGPHQECLPPLELEKGDHCSCREIARAFLAALAGEQMRSGLWTRMAGKRS